MCVTMWREKASGKGWRLPLRFTSPRKADSRLSPESGTDRAISWNWSCFLLLLPPQVFLFLLFVCTICLRNFLEEQGWKEEEEEDVVSPHPLRFQRRRRGEKQGGRCGRKETRPTGRLPRLGAPRRSAAPDSGPDSQDWNGLGEGGKGSGKRGNVAEWLLSSTNVASIVAFAYSHSTVLNVLTSVQS